jgi:hypothetical protein
MPISWGASNFADGTLFQSLVHGAFSARFMLATVLAATAFTAARAEEPQSLPPVTVDAPPPKLVLPSSESGNVQAQAPTTIGGSKPGTGDNGHERCVDVTIGNDTSFGCINERFKRKVDEVNPVLNTPPIDAKSSDLKVGTVNIPAVQQQYGKNFGHSVVPYRPTIVYPSMIGRR